MTGIIDDLAQVANNITPEPIRKGLHIIAHNPILSGALAIGYVGLVIYGFTRK
jgi:hypothetical protein